MRLTRLRIENFRSIRQLDIELGDTTVFIGPNNAGKTAILYAVRIALTRRWGQRGTGFTEYDVHLANETDDPKASPGVAIELRAEETAAGECPDALQQNLDEIMQTDRDGLLGRASKRLADEEGILPQLGPARLDGELRRYIWKGKDHLSLKDLREYLDRYTCLPRLKDRSVLVRTVATAIGGMLPGPFAYAGSWDDTAQAYGGLAIDNAINVQVVIDNESVIVRPDVAEVHCPQPLVPVKDPGSSPPSSYTVPIPETDAGMVHEGQPTEEKPTRFIGAAMISPERPARDIHRIVEVVVEQLTALPGSVVTLKLEIDAEVPSGLDRAQVRTLIENANTLGFGEKLIK